MESKANSSPRSSVALSRRRFLQVSSLAGGGLLLAGKLPAWAASLARSAPEAAAGSWINAWVRITADDQVTLMLSQAEMGQGISTTLPALLADELGADWARVRLELTPYDVAYQNPRVHWMFTGNSESVQSFHDHLRHMGAAAREMLVAAAAARWQVAPERCEASEGRVLLEDSRKTFTFGELAAEAAQLPAPAEPRLKMRQEQKLIGKSLPKVDVPAKVDGSAVFGIDFKVPGMLLAAIRTAPPIGATVRPFDAQKALARPGVKAVVPLPNGVAVVAESYWQARSALLALELAFEAGPHAELSSDLLARQYAEALEHGPVVTPVQEGQVDALLTGSGRVLKRDYHNAFAAHATMEPMNATAHVTAESCEIWAPTQGQELAFYALRAVLGLAPEKIKVNRTPFLGGAFGRRLLPDFIVQAALISKSVGAPVKVIWDREEDQRRDFYRPATAMRMEALLGEDGMPEALRSRLVSPTILKPVFPPIEETLVKQKLDPSALEGLIAIPYRIEKRQLDFHLLETPVPTSVMRTTGYGPNVFGLESFVDELASAAGIDPLTYRQRLLAHHPRALAVLERVARLGGWGEPSPAGTGRGLAFSEAFGSLIAQVLEVRVKGAAVEVLRASTVVDCGRTLDPGIARAGIEGGIVFGLAYCKTEVTFAGGAVVEDNLDRYSLPTLAEAPELVTEFIDSDGPLGGVGEVSPITVPPALANAIFAATGKRIRSWPLGRHGLDLVALDTAQRERKSA